MRGPLSPIAAGDARSAPDGNWHSDRMRARSALFDVYGDHLRSRGDQAPVSSLIRLLEPVGIAAPAVRTAISRMSAQGWLEPTRVDAAPGYRATRRAIERLTEAAVPDLPPRSRAVGRTLAAGVRRPARASAAPGSGCGRSCTTSGTPSTPRRSGCARSTGPRSTRWSPAPAGARRHARRGRPLPRPGGRVGPGGPRHVVRRAGRTWRTRWSRGDPDGPGRRGRGGVRGAVPARPRVAQVPLRRPRAAGGAASPRLAGPGGRRPVHQRGGAPQARPPTASWPAAWACDRTPTRLPLTCGHDR